MGVTGLWKLIDPCSNPVPLETLEGKILAVDVSIWLHQAVKGFQDKHGAALTNAHLLGLFYRLCKLLYYRVKPIFVFDGCVPQLKRETIARRNMQRNKVRNEADRIQGLLLQSLAKERIVHQVLSVNAAELPLKSNKCVRKDRSMDDIFKLPQMPEPITSRIGEDEQNDSEIYLSDSIGDCSTTTTEDSSFEESNRYHNYNVNLQCIDVRSKQFKSLPADVRHDILIDIKETRKQSSWGRLHELPEKFDDFSSFQMRRLLKRRAVQESIEEVEKEMGGCSLTYNELKKVFAEKGIVEGTSIVKSSKQICSDENTRYLLVSDLKKKLKTQNHGFVVEEHSELIEKPCSSQQVVTATKEAESDSNEGGLDDEFNIDFELAVTLSLEQPTTHILQYEGIPDDQLIAYHSSGQSMDTALKSEASSAIDNTSRKISASESNSELTNVADSEIDLMSTSESDSEDLEKESYRSAIDQNICINKNFEIVLDPTKPLTPKDDFFSDIFNEKITVEQKPTTDPDFQNNTLSNSNPITPSIKGVLDELKKQASDIHIITLDDINIFPSPIEVSNGEKKNYTENREILTEIIKLADVDCIEHKQMPQVKTPSKEINPFSECTETDVRESTPKQPKNDNNVRKEMIPVFVNKTKTLLTKEYSISDSNPTSVLYSDMSNDSKSLSPPRKGNLHQVTSSSTEDVLNQAANMLNQKRNIDKLTTLASNIAQENLKLTIERNRQDRMTLSISERMKSDCQELLRLFGIPYIVAPMEAEAQCAFLDAMHLTNGTITDDSDIWLFGGRTVYKNFFAQNKHVLEFRADNIEKVFNCDRPKLIELACLVGSDYTSGIHGIGAVTAMEILSTFSCKKGRQNQPNASTSTIMSTLSRFRDWWLDNKATGTTPSNSTRLSLLKKLQNIELHEGFPNIAVIEAYLSPKVDDNTENFTWGYPNIESIREFTTKTFGWNISKTDHILMPVLKKINEKKSQATIDNYFSVKNASSLKPLKLSRRVQSAIDKMSDKVEEKVVQLKRPAMIKRKIQHKRKKQTVSEKQ